jgi:hypothetical protein
MPYANPFVQVTAEGVFGSSASTPVEIWRAGFKVASLAGPPETPALLPAFLAAIAPAFSTLHANAAVGAGQFAKLVALSAGVIGVDGRYLGGGLQVTARFTYATPVNGGGSAAGPFSQANVATLRTSIERGPGSHGRIYWPAQALLVDASLGVRNATQQAATASAWKTCLDAVNTAAIAAFGSSSRVSVASNVGSGVTAPVVRVGCGAKLDSMETREKNLSEAHVFSSLANVAQFLTDAQDRLRDRIEEELDD